MLNPDVAQSSDSCVVQVMVDGADIKTLPLHWWRSNIGLVSQEPVLFGGTIYENLTFGQQDADPKKVAAACEVANAMTFIQSAPDGLDTKARPHPPSQSAAWFARH